MHKKLQGMTIPTHIGFIMDGNGRWAMEKGKTRTAGHKAGSDTLKSICKAAYDIGVKYVTVYAFSTENWKRPQKEVDFLMNLLRQYMKDSVKESKKNNMRVRVIGDRTGLPEDIQDSIIKMESSSQHHTGLNLQIALNYGSRNELLRGIKHLTQDVTDGKVTIDEIDEALFSSYLDTSDIPDPDLLIRTSGEIRLSNFLLWQLAYTEFYFTPLYWPDFDKQALMDAVIAYNKKERRYGGLIDEA